MVGPSSSSILKVLVFVMSAKYSMALIRHLSVYGMQKRKLITTGIGSISQTPNNPSGNSVADLRKEYSSQGLVENNDTVEGGPFRLFEAWLNDACTAKVIEPNAMCLSTCTDNRPSARYVLLKGYDDRGFVWYTNYESRKSNELLDNPHAALTFWWGDLERSVRIEGTVEKVAETESDEYFGSRPRGSQIGAWSSNQSRPIRDRAALEEQEKQIVQKFSDGGPVPRPPHWGGFRLIPNRMEFWKGRASRLHDRLVFERQDKNSVWKLQRLQP